MLRRTAQHFFSYSLGTCKENQVEFLFQQDAVFLPSAGDNGDKF